MSSDKVEWCNKAKAQYNKVNLDALYAVFLVRKKRSQVLLDLLEEVSRPFNWICHSWFQMSNHYRIIIETPEGRLAQGMHQLKLGIDTSIHHIQLILPHPVAQRFSGSSQCPGRCHQIVAGSV